MKQKAVFVDIDNTIVKGATLKIFGQFFLFRKRINFIFFIRVLYWYLQYKRNKLHDFDPVLHHLTDVTRDWDVPSTQTMLQECFQNKIRPRLYIEMLARLRQHHEDGYIIFFVSSTIQPIADLIIDYLGFGIPVTTIPKVVDNHFTSELIGKVCYGQEKIARINNILTHYKIDLSQSITYTDHISDLPLLELVGQPVVVNPGRKLAEIAQLRGWAIVKTKDIQK